MAFDMFRYERMVESSNYEVSGHKRHAMVLLYGIFSAGIIFAICKTGPFAASPRSISHGQSAPMQMAGKYQSGVDSSGKSGQGMPQFGLRSWFRSGGSHPNLRLSNPFGMNSLQIVADGVAPMLQHRQFKRFVSAATTRASSERISAPPLRIALLGGPGRIGTAVAVHLFARLGTADTELILIGRTEARGLAAVEEVRAETGKSQASVKFQKLDWSVRGALQKTLMTLQVDAVLHTAGPFDEDLQAGVLGEVIAAGVPVYVDVADPVDYLSAAKAMDNAAKKSGTMALVSAGAFPGFSNVLARECAQRLSSKDGGPPKIQDVDFAYFTAGLGGSGPINLLITNLGFGEPVPLFRDGAYSPQLVAGTQLRKVKFFLDEDDPAFKAVGERDVWSWPFPEAKTVAEHLKISGSSSTGMGTAPGIWNTILVALVALVPRDLWRARWFSEGLAQFSLPMVALTDRFVNETHAMRVEVTGSDGCKCVAVQAHRSFRRCVAQSAAEFTLELLQRRAQSTHLSDDRSAAEATLWQPGVWLPEELPDDGSLVQRLGSTEGTISFGFNKCTA